MYIPLSCAMVVEIYRYSRTANRPIPQTMTQLYVEMSLTLLQRHLDGKDVSLLQELPKSLQNLPPQLKKPFASLAKLAFEGMVKGEVIFDKLPVGCNHFGFMNSLTELYMGREASVSHSFLHLTLQEFLTAFYISQLSPSDQKSVFEEHCSWAGGWDVVWMFVAGLSGFRGIGWELVHSRRGEIDWVIGQDEDKRTLPFLVHCLFEADDKVNYDSVFQGGSVVSFGSRFVFLELTPLDCYIVGQCIAHTTCMWRLNMQHNPSLGDILVEMLKHGLQSPSGKSPPRKKYANILSLDLSDCGLTSTGFNQLADIIPHMTNLKELRAIRNNRPGDGGLVNLLHSLSHLKNLQTLDMHYTDIGCTDIEALSHLISPSGCLKELDIGDEDMSPECTELMLKTVLSPSSLESVGFWKVTWSDEAMALLGANFNLSTLEFTNELTNASVLTLNNAIQHNHTLKQLKLKSFDDIEHLTLDPRITLSRF